MAGFFFDIGITAPSAGIGTIWSGKLVSNPTAMALGVELSAMAYSAMGILFASIPTGSLGEVIISLNFVSIPLMFVSGMFIPLERMPAASTYAAFLSPLTHTLDLLKLGMGDISHFGWAANIGILITWLIVFLFVGQMFHRIIMKRE